MCGIYKSDTDELICKGEIETDIENGHIMGEEEVGKTLR